MSEKNLYEVSVQKITNSNVLPAFKMNVFSDKISEADSIVAEIADMDGYRVASAAVLVGTFDPDAQLVTHLDPNLDLETSIINSLDGLMIMVPEDGQGDL